MDFKQIAMMLGQILPLVEPYIPEMTPFLSAGIPQWMMDTAKKHNVEKVVIILDTYIKDDKPVALLKFMTPVAGKLEPLKKEDGSPYVESASKFITDILNMGIDNIKKAQDEE
jgi:hypothetical protein